MEACQVLKYLWVLKYLTLGTKISDEFRYVIFDAPRVKGGLMKRLQAAKDKIDGTCKYARVHEHEVC